MKILFIGSNPKQSGGIETFGRNLQEIFGQNIHFYSLYKGEELYKVENVFESLPNNILGKLLNRMSLRKVKYIHINKLISKNKYNYILINSPKDLLFLSKKNLKKKIILVQHQTSKRFYESPNFLDKNSKNLENIKKYINKIIMLSPEDKIDFNKVFGIELEKMQVIRHMSKLDINNEEKKVKNKLITICRIDNEHKRIDLILEGMKKLSNFELEVWGDGADKLMLENRAKELKLTNVKFMGKTSNVKEKLDSSSIFLMTSDYEGYPIATIEATRRGLPIIARNTYCSVTDAIKTNGILLNKEWNVNEFVDAVNKIHKNYEFYNKAAINEAKKYDYEIISQEWKNLFK